MKEKYEKLVQWLTNWGADRWLHFICGLIVAFVSAVIVGKPLWLAVQVGFVVSTVVGFAKECADAYLYDDGDFVDWKFAVWGGITGCLMYLFAGLWLG